jgi:hypothetical protein
MARRKSATGVENRLASKLKRQLLRLNAIEDDLDDLRYKDSQAAAAARRRLLEQSADLELKIGVLGTLLEDEYGWSINDRGELVPPR